MAGVAGSIELYRKRHGCQTEKMLRFASDHLIGVQNSVNPVGTLRFRSGRSVLNSRSY